MVSGAWFGAPAIVVAATGGELSETQVQAWRDWDKGAYNAGRGAAMVVSGAYVGAPGIVLDQIKNGATPADLQPAQVRQVSFLVDPNSPVADEIPAMPESPLPQLPELPLDILDLVQGW